MLVTLSTGTNWSFKSKSYKSVINHWSRNCTHCFGTFSWQVCLCRLSTTKKKSSESLKKSLQSSQRTPRIRKKSTGWTSCRRWCKTNLTNRQPTKTWHWSTSVSCFPASFQNSTTTAFSQSQTLLSRCASTPEFYTRLKTHYSPSTSLSCCAHSKCPTSISYTYWAPF